MVEIIHPDMRSPDYWGCLNLNPTNWEPIENSLFAMYMIHTHISSVETTVRGNIRDSHGSSTFYGRMSDDFVEFSKRYTHIRGVNRFEPLGFIFEAFKLDDGAYYGSYGIIEGDSSLVNLETEGYFALRKNTER